MNITSCPRCGGRVRSVSIGWKCESCQGFIDMRGEFHQHKEEPFMLLITNADRIRAMSDEELAAVLCTADFCNYCDYEREDGTCLYIETSPDGRLFDGCVSAALKYLKQLAEEGT